jgi:hypothetical protein
VKSESAKDPGAIPRYNDERIKGEPFPGIPIIVMTYNNIL